MDDIQGRAQRLAIDSVFSAEMIAEFLMTYPMLDDDEVQICLQLGANPVLGELLRRLYTAGEVYRRLDGGKRNGRTEVSHAV
jgi:hypothetical protein